MTTWRTLTNKKKFSLVYFEVDDTYAVVDTKRIRASCLEKDKEVDVRCGSQTYKGKIIELNGKYFEMQQESIIKLIYISYILSGHIVKNW